MLGAQGLWVQTSGCGPQHGAMRFVVDPSHPFVDGQTRSAVRGEQFPVPDNADQDLLAVQQSPMASAKKGHQPFGQVPSNGGGWAKTRPVLRRRTGPIRSWERTKAHRMGVGGLSVRDATPMLFRHRAVDLPFVYRGRTQGAEPGRDWRVLAGTGPSPEALIGELMLTPTRYRPAA